MAGSAYVVKRIEAERFLALASRTFARLEAEGVLVPSKRGSRGVPSVYDLRTLVPAYITHLKSQSARHTEQEARARREQSQAELNELKLAQLRGEVVDAAAVEKSWADHITEARNALLGIPTKTKARAPHLTRDDVAIIDAVIREALESLSGPVNGDGSDPDED